jgi:multicomponent Na+:H+ antiporter subunit D
MMASLPPGWIVMLGALLIPLVPSRARSSVAILLPILGFLHLLSLPEGTSGALEVFSYQLTLVRLDPLARIFGYIFHIAAFASALYAFHVRDTAQHVAAMIYAGSAIAAVFAGDLITLFVYWELTALSSVFLIWASKTERSYRAGIRYLIIQVGSGVLLLAGVLFHFTATGSLAFTKLIGEDGDIFAAGPGVVLIFLAFGIKCAFPFLHNWLQDSYPQATVTGTVFLSAFTTKLAIYALARGFPGTSVLIVIGVVMTLFPIFFAVIENDLRKVLAYSLNNQLGFMVTGIGIGTALALNGTVAHAFAHILYKGLLFMSMGAVLYRTKTIKASELGGLYKAMPWTATFCMIGAASISAFPFFSGFVSKSLILSGAAAEGYAVAWLLLLVASAGVMEHSGIKIPFFAFFGHDSGKWKETKEAPLHMLVAMGIVAFLCVAIGCYPQPLYDLLPFEMAETFHPYTWDHVVTQYQLLLFATLAFAVLWRIKVYPPEVDSVNLDFDYVYRRLVPRIGVPTLRAVVSIWDGGLTLARWGLGRALVGVQRLHGPGGAFARTWKTGQIVFFAALMLGFYLLFYFL